MPTNITLTSKYVEDASGNKFAPITTPNAVRFSDGTNLNDHLGGTQADWNESDTTDPSYIQNKPTSLPANGGNATTVNNHTVLSNVPANAVFTDTTYTTMGASGSGHASGLVPDTPSTAGTTKFLREDGTWVVPTADVSSKEDKMSIDTSYLGPISTISPAINTTYLLSTPGTSIAVALPAITDPTKVQSFVLFVNFFGKVGQSANVTISGSNCIVYFPEDMYFEVGKMYEINCMFIGQFTREGGEGEQSTTINIWAVASHAMMPNLE